MRPVAVGVTVSLLVIATSVAQQPASPTPQTPPAEGRVRFEDLPAAAQLGARAEGIRRRVGVVPVIVIVPDAPSYVEAISRWSIAGMAKDQKSGGARFPVLIDDGSWRAREDIARFVRGFGPAKVVRWSAADAKAAWPKTPEEVASQVEKSAARAWGAADAASLRETWKTLKYAPPGVVVASVEDPAWTAALALAAGRGQPFAWVKAPRNLSGVLPFQDARALSDSAAKACTDAGFQWAGTGDEIEAVTLCLNSPAITEAAAGDDRKRLATTDVIGRGTSAGPEQRWAWTSQIVGNEARAAYMAMCSLFIQPNRAWLFDGYDNSEPWSRWDATAAAVTLEKRGLNTLVSDNGNQGEEQWRTRAAGLGLRANEKLEDREPGSGVDAGLIFVNTKGYPEFFELMPGKAYAADVPFLHVPAGVHFVHSFSAARAGDRTTIAGRFLERGVFNYVGAVHEPGLQAFLPTPLAASRLSAGGAWAASVRQDDGPAWKVALFGDPLWVLGEPAPRTDLSFVLTGATDVAEQLQTAVKEKKYVDIVSSLALLGRDADAHRVMRLIYKDEPAALTAEVALAGVMSVVRSPGSTALAQHDRAKLIARICTLLEPRYAQEPELRDVPWHALYATRTSLNAAEITVLAHAIRPEQAGRDAPDLVSIAVRSLGRTEAESVLSSITSRLPEASARAIQQALAR